MHDLLSRRTFHAALAGLVLASNQGLQPEDKDDEAAKLKWGDFSATFLYDGEPPKPQELRVDKDVEAFKLPLLDRSLQVDAKTKGVANVVVWLHVAAGQKPPIHASYAELAKQEVLLENRNGQIEPHVTILWTEQTLLMKNADRVGHNQIGNLFANSALGELAPVGSSIKRNLRKQETRPFPLSCNIHPWEQGWLLVRDNPHMAVSDAQGKLTIKNLPVGELQLVFWHEKVGFLTEWKRDGKLEKVPRGRLGIAIKPGENKFGELVIKPERKP
jgi:hypothetical protein